MSQIIASVTHIQQDRQLHIVTFEHFGYTLTMMSLELPELKIGGKVILNIKSSNVGISKNKPDGMSFSNCLKTKVIKIDIGNLLCVVRMQLDSKVCIDAIITAKSALLMQLKTDEEAYALFKASELSIYKALE